MIEVVSFGASETWLFDVKGSGGWSKNPCVVALCGVRLFVAGRPRKQKQRSRDSWACGPGPQIRRHESTNRFTEQGLGFRV